MKWREPLKRFCCYLCGRVALIHEDGKIGAYVTAFRYGWTPNWDKWKCPDCKINPLPLMAGGLKKESVDETMKTPYTFRCADCGRAESTFTNMREIAVKIAIRSGWVPDIDSSWTCNICLAKPVVTEEITVYEFDQTVEKRNEPKMSNTNLNLDLSTMTMAQMLDLITLAQEAEKQIGSKFLREFGENVKMWREDRALEQDDLAKLIGNMTKATMEKLESGNLDIPLSRVPRFCAVLDVDVADLLPRTKEPKVIAVFQTPAPAIPMTPIVKTTTSPVTIALLAAEQEPEPEEEAEEPKVEPISPFDTIDLIYPKAITVAAIAGEISIALFQRELKLGYSDASKIVERMKKDPKIGIA